MALDTIGFYCTGHSLDPNTILQPGNWGRTIQQWGNAHRLFNQEMALEAERANNFPDRQSRLTANFIWPRLNDAKWYRAHHHPADSIYEIRFDQQLPLHQGVFLCLPPLRGFSDAQAIRHYWAFDHGVYWDQDPGYMPIEIVTASPLLVLGNVTLP